MNTRISIFLLLLTLIFIHACTSDKVKDIPDVSGIAVQVDLNRFDQALFALDTNNMAAGLPALEVQHGEFAEIFFGHILGSKDPNIAPEGHAEYIRGFIAHPGIRQLYDTTQVVFPLSLIHI